MVWFLARKYLFSPGHTAERVRNTCIINGKTILCIGGSDHSSWEVATIFSIVAIDQTGHGKHTFVPTRFERAPNSGDHFYHR